MRKTLMSLTIITMLLFTVLMAKLEEGSASQGSFLAKATSGQVTRTLSNISNWSYWMNYNGMSGRDPQDNAGGYYPRGTAAAVFQDGFIWGGKVSTEIRVGGQTYNVGTTQGWIQSDGTAVSKDNPRARIYRIRTDYETLNHEKVLQEAAEANMVSASSVTTAMTDAIIEQYETDWNEWPADLGAPTYADGTPGIANADQVIWFVCNDLDRVNCLSLYDSEPIGIELQVTAWAYHGRPDSRLGQIIFKKYKLINKSGMNVTDMYVSQWSDPDLGNAGDDLVGCDTLLSLGYAYNGQDVDNKYAAFGLAPAACGYDLLQGPMVDGVAGQDLNKNGVDDAEDYAVFDLKVVGPGKINLPMTTFGWFAAGSAISDPTLGEYEGTLQWYNMLLGNTPTDNMTDPTPWTVGNEGTEVTKFPMAGDPVTGTGDLDAHASFFSPGDRRIALCSGPFTFADGDTQEVVVAVVGGLGDTRFSSITDMKMTDNIAQLVFNSVFEGMPSVPPVPNVIASGLNKKIVLTWDNIAESYNESDIIDVDEYGNPTNYHFEGYAVYQLINLYDIGTKKLIAVFDRNNGIKNIRDYVLDIEYGEWIEQFVMPCKDNGIRKYIYISVDEFNNNEPLVNNQTYYFAVTAFGYNEFGKPRLLESCLTPIEVSPVGPINGIDYTVAVMDEVEHVSGTCDGELFVNVIDPSHLKGHDYEVFFNQQHYYMDVDGKWKTTNYPDSVGKALGKVADVSPSTITGVAYTSPIAGTIDLKLVLDLVSPDYNYAEGVKLTFPPDIVINSATGPNRITALIDESENTVLFGNEVVDSTDLTGAGAFAGGELMTVNVNTPTLPLVIAFIVYDDGWATLYCADPANADNCAAWGITDAVVVNAEGTCIISEQAYVFKTVNYWNIRDLTINDVVLADQTIVSGIDVDTGVEAGNNAVDVLDGFQVNINASYDAPTDFTKYTHTGPNRTTPDVFSYAHAMAWLAYDQHGKPFIITSYAQYAWGAYGPTATAWDTYDYAPDGAQHGTQSMNLLQLDVELRFTGEYDATTIAMAGGGTYHPIKDGTGSLATLVGARNYDIKDHPDVNNPGTGEPFLIRIPFEVWDIDNDKQISIVIYDRYGNPTATDIYAFNPADRMYCWFLEEDYAATLTDPVANTNSNLFTWNTVFWNCDWTSGDKILFQYNNPIQLGVDVFQFSTTAPTQFDIAKGDVNNDGDVNISDAVKLINYILQLDDLSGEQQYAADFNSDLELNIADVVGIVYDILGLSKSLAKSSSQGIVNIGLHEKAAVSDDIVSVPIVMNTDMSLAGMQLELEYDPLLLKPLTPNFSSAKWKRISAVKNSPETGSVIFLFYDLAGSTLPSNDLPILQFKNISEQSELSSNIILVNAVVSNAQGVSAKIEFGNTSASTVPVPESYALHQNYPNPFNPLTTIRYDLPEMSHVSIQIYNMLGQKVRTLMDKKQFAGEYQVQWNSRNDQGQVLSSGIYFMQFKAGDFVRHQKLTLLK